MKNLKKRNLALALGLLMALIMTSRVAFGYYGTTYPWTMYRYDVTRQGLTSSTAPNTNNTVWSSTTIYGLGIPVVVNGMVIVTGGSSIYALDETTGVKLWGSISFSGSAYDPPAVVGDRIYFGTSGGYFYCYNATNGEKIWEYDARPGQVQTSPAVSSGKVYFGTTDNYLYALDALTGAFLWRYTAGGAIYYSSPAIDGDLLYFGCDDGKVYALNITGSLPALKWFYPTNGQIRSTPCVADGKVFFGSYYTDHALFAVNKITGGLVWKYSLASNYAITTTPAFFGGIVFFTGSYSKAYALYSNATSGINYTESDPAIRLWSQTVGTYPSSPVVADGKIFICCNDYKLYALAVTTGILIWTNTFSSYTPSEPIVADARIFVSNYYGVYCLGNYFPPVTYYYQVTPVPGRTFGVQLVVNATPSGDLDVSGLMTLKRINYTVEGISGTTGMSNITIPNALLSGPYTVTVDGGLPLYSAAPVDNGTHTSLYFTYLHSVHKIEIIGTTVLPQLEPAVSILSPENRTYATDNVSLAFTLDKSTSWIGYSLNGQANVTIAGNTTLTSLPDGAHGITVYANSTGGSMGASNTVYFAVDTVPPNITNVVQIPIASNVQVTDTVNINATVTDNLSGIIQVSLNYTNGSGTLITIPMTSLGGNIYNSIIPAFSAGTNVTYVIIAADNANNTITTVQLGYTYQYIVVPEFPTSLILPTFMIATLIAMIFYRGKVKHNSANIL
jgi:outer membrane protein assembly factor BamB